MNLNFISPLYLLGLLGIGLPILVHLLTRRQQIHLKFSAVYLLSQSQKRSIKKSRPNRLLLLLFRCLAVMFFSLALANPIFSFGGPEELLPDVSASNVIVLDDSYSMATLAGESSLYRKAVDYLAELLPMMSAENEFSLVLASAPARVAQGWTGDRERVLKLLQVSKPSYRTTQIGTAVAKAFQLLKSSSNNSRRIFILTDRAKNGWRPENFPDLSGTHPNYKVTVVDFSKYQQTPSIAAIDKTEVTQEFLSNSRIIRLKATVKNLESGKRISQLPIALWVEGKKTAEGFLDIPPNSTAVKEFSFPLMGEDLIHGRVEIQADALPVDDRRLFSYQPDLRIKVLVVDGDPKTVGHQSETFYLEHALNPLATPLSDIDPIVSTLSELARRNISRYSVIILCNVRELPFGYERKLEEFVLRGGALFVFLGDQVDAKFYNEKLGNLLPVKIESLNQVGINDEPFHLLLRPTDHPVMKIFSAKTMTEMQSIRFHSLYSVEPREGRKFTIPMRFSNQFPALVETEFGKGKVLLFVSSVDRDWNNFPIQPTFLPWIQRWIKYSAHSLESITRKDLLVGEPFVWEKEGDAGFVKTPGGKIYPLKTGDPAGSFRFEDTHRPGVYQIYRSRQGTGPKPGSPSDAPERPTFKIPAGSEPLGGFTVNVDTRESDPEKISEKEIRGFFPGMMVEINTDPEAPSGSPLEKNFPLTTPFFLLVVGMLFLEGFLVRKE